MKTFTLFIFSLFSFTKVSAQAFVWEQPIDTQNNGVTSDANENVIVFGSTATITRLAKFTKDGILIWKREYSRQGNYNTSSKASVVTDNSGNIYIYDQGFDSIDHVFTGILLPGISKISPNGTLIWHQKFYYSYIAYPNTTVYPNVTKVALQIDASENIYTIFGINSYPGTVTLGNTSVAVPTPYSNIHGCLAVGSLKKDGTTNWLRAFPWSEGTGLTWDVAGAGVLGNRLYIDGHATKSFLVFDNGLNVVADRSTEWIVAINTLNGQSIWGKSHGLFWTCNGILCANPIPGFALNPVSGRATVIGGLRGAFVFKPADTVSSQKITIYTADTARSYYAMYDSNGTPVKAKIYHPDGWSTSGVMPNFSTVIAASRTGHYFTNYSDTLVKFDTGFNIKSQNKMYIIPTVIQPSRYTNDLFMTYPSGSHYYLRKMVDSAAVISGKTYADWNNNGVYDAGDSAVANSLVSTNNTAVNAISSNDSGKYKIYASPGSYTINANFSHPYYQFLPLTHSATITSYSDTIQGKDFRLRPLFNFTDVSVKISALNSAKPGFYTTYNLTVKNIGPTVTPITVGLRIPPLTTYVGGGGAGSTVTLNAPDSITISYGNVNPWQSKTAQIVLVISTTAVIGDILRFYPIAYPYAIDTLKYNNRDTLIQAVRGSWDPNEKEVNASKQSISDTSKALVYTVHFQNTGNDTAFYVRIADTLSAKLDANTFNYIDASHTVTTEIKNNVLNFIFNPIALPDSNHNEPLSHGFVKFSLKPKSPVNIVDTIYNNAAIYFDFNAPVITNQAKTWFDNVALPVVLKSFVAEKQIASVLLKFITGSEPGLKNFIIERSADGIIFSAIGTVASKGDASTGSVYAFTDPSPKQGINFYRLKMVDKDGRFTYSWIVIVQFDKDQQSIKVFPNPANDNLYINFSNSNSTETYACRLIDAEGKTVWAADVNTATRNTLSISTSTFAEGVYFISVKNEQADYQQKVVIKH